MVLVYC